MLCQWKSCLCWSSLCYLINIVLLAECVKNDVDLVEHVHHLHGADVDTDLIKLHHIAEQDGHVWEHLEGDNRSKTVLNNSRTALEEKIKCCSSYFINPLEILISMVSLY